MRRPHLPEWAKRKGPLLAATSVGVVFAFWVLIGGYSPLEGTSVNVRFKARNRYAPWSVPSDQVVFVDINDAALEANIRGLYYVPRRWPWERTRWAVIHGFLKDNHIKPAAIVYDIVFDLADDETLEKGMGYHLPVSASDTSPTYDKVFQDAIQAASDTPTFLAALFRPQGKKAFGRAEYAKAKSSANVKETRIWQPPPTAFTRFGIPYVPADHDPVFHAREIAIPWDTEWWASTVPKEDLVSELEFMGLSSSLLKPAAGSGTTTMDPETDGITRWGPLFFEYDNILYPSLPMQVVLKLFGATLSQVRFEEGAVTVPKSDGSEVQIPVDARKRILINFRYAWPDPDSPPTVAKGAAKGFQYVNYWRLMEGFDQLDSVQKGEKKELDPGTFDPTSLNGKIVIIGSTAQATHDLRAVPVGERYPMVGTLGEIIRSIEQEDFLYMAHPWVNALWIIGGTFLVGMLGQFFAPIKHAVATVALSAAHIFSCYFLFAYGGIVVDFFHVSFAEIVAYAIATIVQYLQVSSIFGRYVTPDVRRYLLSNKAALELGGQETEVSILFSDLSGFTSMSEKMQAPEVIATLNDYFAPMFKIIIDEGHGTLDKLIGDAIMAYFGHPVPTPDHPVRAVTAALKMQRRLSELREKWSSEGRPPIRMRIGVNTGAVVAGNMGDTKRTDYSIIGDNVNLASRLESNAPVDGVLISESTYERVKDHFKFKEREPIKVKGKEKPVKVYEVLDFA
jgi:adenylate cyclase